MWPLLRLRAQTGGHWIVLDVAKDTGCVIMVANGAVEVVFVPEWALPAENEICLPRCESLNTPHDAPDRDVRIQQNVDVVGHDHPATEFEGACLMAVP